MGSFSIWHWIIVLILVLVLFGGGGKLSRVLGDLGEGLKNFKKNIADDKTNGKKMSNDDLEEVTYQRSSSVGKGKAKKSSGKMKSGSTKKKS